MPTLFISIILLCVISYILYKHKGLLVAFIRRIQLEYLFFILALIIVILVHLGYINWPLIFHLIDVLDDWYTDVAVAIYEFCVHSCHKLVTMLYVALKAYGWAELGNQLREGGYAVLDRARKYGFKIPTIAVILSYIKNLIFGNEYDKFNRILHDYTFNKGVGPLTMAMANLKLLTIGCNYNNKDYILWDYLHNGSKNVTRLNVTTAYINYWLSGICNKDHTLILSGVYNCLIGDTILGITPLIMATLKNFLFGVSYDNYSQICYNYTFGSRAVTTPALLLAAARQYLVKLLTDDFDQVLADYLMPTRVSRASFLIALTKWHILGTRYDDIANVWLSYVSGTGGVGGVALLISIAKNYTLGTGYDDIAAILSNIAENGFGVSLTTLIISMLKHYTIGSIEDNYLGLCYSNLFTDHVSTKSALIALAKFCILGSKYDDLASIWSDYATGDKYVSSATLVLAYLKHHALGTKYDDFSSIFNSYITNGSAASSWALFTAFIKSLLIGTPENSLDHLLHERLTHTDAVSGYVMAVATIKNFIFGTSFDSLPRAVWDYLAWCETKPMRMAAYASLLHNQLHCTTMTASGAQCTAALYLLGAKHLSNFTICAALLKDAMFGVTYNNSADIIWGLIDGSRNVTTSMLWAVIIKHLLFGTRYDDIVGIYNAVLFKSDTHITCWSLVAAYFYDIFYGTNRKEYYELVRTNYLYLFGPKYSTFTDVVLAHVNAIIFGPKYDDPYQLMHDFLFKNQTTIVTVIVASIKHILFGNEYDDFPQIVHDFLFDDNRVSLTEVIVALLKIWLGDLLLRITSADWFKLLSFYVSLRLWYELGRIEVFKPFWWFSGKEEVITVKPRPLTPGDFYTTQWDGSCLLWNLSICLVMYIAIAACIICAEVRKVYHIARLHFFISWLSATLFILGFSGYVTMGLVPDSEHFWLMSRWLDALHVCVSGHLYYYSHVFLVNLIIIEIMALVVTSMFIWVMRYWLYKPLYSVLYIASIVIGLIVALNTTGMVFEFIFMRIEYFIPYTLDTIQYVTPVRLVACLCMFFMPAFGFIHSAIYGIYTEPKVTPLRTDWDRPGQISIEHNPIDSAFFNLVVIYPYNKYRSRCLTREERGIKFQIRYVKFFKTLYNVNKQKVYSIYKDKNRRLLYLYTFGWVVTTIMCLFVFL